MSSPKRDKFAALSQRHQQEQKAEESGGAEPAGTGTGTEVLLRPSQAAAVAAASADPTPAAHHSPVKRDKFAALAARTQAGSGATPAGSATAAAPPPPPKRDKFAALAARGAPPGASSAVADAADPNADVAGRQATAPPRRDKFAALASSSSSAAPPVDMTTRTSTLTKPSSKERQVARREELLKRRKQRQSVWEDLDAAEHVVTEILEVARRTCEELAAATTTASDRNGSPSSSSSSVMLRQLADRYSSLVKTVHGKLRPHAGLVQAYHAPSSINSVYVAKVQARLAQERRDLLKQHVEVVQRQIEQRHRLGTDQDGAKEAVVPSLEEATEAWAGEKRKRNGGMPES